MDTVPLRISLVHNSVIANGESMRFINNSLSEMKGHILQLTDTLNNLNKTWANLVNETGSQDSQKHIKEIITWSLWGISFFGPYMIDLLVFFFVMAARCRCFPVKIRFPLVGLSLYIRPRTAVATLILYGASFLPWRRWVCRKLFGSRGQHLPDGGDAGAGGAAGGVAAAATNAIANGWRAVLRRWWGGEVAVQESVV